MELHSAAELLFPSVQDTNAKTALFTALFPNMTFFKEILRYYLSFWIFVLLVSGVQHT